MTVEELMAHALVISLYPERIAIMRRAFAREGLPMPRVIHGISLRHLAHNRWWRACGGTGGAEYHSANCSASHLMCVRTAEALGWPCVAVFEDDAWPCAGARAALERELAGEPRGVLMLGWFKRRRDAAGVVRYCGAHAYVVAADAYRTYAAAYREELPCYHADLVLHLSAALRAAVRFADRCVFAQMNACADRGATYAHPELYVGGVRQGRRGVPPEGFPSYEEVMAEEVAP